MDAYTQIAWRLRGNVYPRITLPNFLSANEIAAIHQHAETLPTHKAKIMSGDVERIRKSKVKWVNPEPAINWLYKKAVDAILDVNGTNFNLNLTGLQTFQYTEYHAEENGFYGAHKDSHILGQGDNIFDRKLSFTIQLSDPSEYDGGLVAFLNNGGTDIAPTGLGHATFFMSDELHEARPVTSGIRRSLVGWVAGPVKA